MVDFSIVWYAACYTFQTVVCLLVNILLKSSSRPIKNTVKLSTLVQRCRQNAENGKTRLMQELEGLLPDPQGNAEPQHIWVSFPISVKRRFFPLPANALAGKMA